MTVTEERALAVLTPMWQRIARGEIDLEQYTDEEILSGQITMADGRLLPKPPVLPELFIQEQEKRGLVVAREKIRDGALKSLDVQYDILMDPLSENRDRLVAAKMFQERFLGKADQRVHVHVESDQDPRDVLIQRLLLARNAVTTGEGDDPASAGIVEAEIVEEPLEISDSGIVLDDLL